MEILGIGPLEALLIILIALIAVGPKDLGKAARSSGRLLNQLYKSEAWHNLSQASRSIRTLPNRLAREAALEELAQVKQEMQEGLTAGIDQIKNIDIGLDQTDIDQLKDPDVSSGSAGIEQPKDAVIPADSAGVEQTKDADLSPIQPEATPDPSPSEKD